jgi:hypothetical protein
VEVATAEERTLEVVLAVAQAGSWGGVSTKDIAAALIRLGRPELATPATLSRLLTGARQAGLLKFGPVFGWRCWYPTEAGRAALRMGRRPKT